MLPILLYNNMEGFPNQLDNSAGGSYASPYDESVILNSVRSRKKVSESPSCPVCSCTIRQGEVESHLTLEVERLQKLSSGVKRKLSASPSTSSAVPGASASASTSASANDEASVDVTGCVGGDVYQRVNGNRLRRLRSRARRSPPPGGDCPVCGAVLPLSKLQKHALRCLKRTGADVDDASSSEDGSIDVENESPSAGGGGGGGGGSFGAEYQWCGEWRVRASALQERVGQQPPGEPASDMDHALVVDGDEDAELYGPPQYSPSRIANPAPSLTDDGDIEMPQQNGTRNHVSAESEGDSNRQSEPRTPRDFVEASAETRIQALKSRIRELEAKSGSESKCLICHAPYTSPAVSIQCWHVYCEECWLGSLSAKKVCPQCNAITTTNQLRRIYM